MIEAPDFLPLGSVVVMKGNNKELMIIARAVVVTTEAGKEYYDYGVCLYPEGLIGGAAIFCNHDQVSQTVFKGYECEANTKYIEEAKRCMALSEVKKGNPSPIGEEW